MVAFADGSCVAALRGTAYNRQHSFFLFWHAAVEMLFAEMSCSLLSANRPPGPLVFCCSKTVHITR